MNNFYLCKWRHVKNAQKTCMCVWYICARMCCIYMCVCMCHVCACMSVYMSSAHLCTCMHTCVPVCLCDNSRHLITCTLIDTMAFLTLVLAMSFQAKVHDEILQKQHVMLIICSMQLLRRSSLLTHPGQNSVMN